MDLGTLMQRIQEGDREAFATLYARYNKTVYRIAFEALGNEQKAVEIVKLVFKEMYQTIRDKGPYLGDLYGWLDALTAKQLRLQQFAKTRPAGMPPSAPPPQYAYSQERASEILARANARVMPPQPPLSFDPDEEEYAPRKQNGGSIVVLSIAAAALLWLFVGLLGSLQIIPQIDLGYAWFNQTLFPFF